VALVRHLRTGRAQFGVGRCSRGAVAVGSTSYGSHRGALGLWTASRCVFAGKRHFVPCGQAV
jgi:hypothetical protein